MTHFQGLDHHFFSDHAMIFFVPKGSKTVGRYTNNRIGKIVANSRTTAFAFSGIKGPEYFSGEVPEEMDNTCCPIQSYLARSEAEVLIPREAQHEVGK